MKSNRKHFLALSLAGIGVISTFASVSAASVQVGTPSTTQVNKSKKIISKGTPSTLTAAQKASMIKKASDLIKAGKQAEAKVILDSLGVKTKEQNVSTNSGTKTTLTAAQKASMIKKASDLIKAGKQAEAKVILDSLGVKTKEQVIGSPLKKIPTSVVPTTKK